MRALVVATTAVGLLLGVAGAVAWHFVDATHTGWFAYSAGPGPVRVSFGEVGWWPAAVVAPALGAVAGLGAGLLLARAGWRLTRGG
jgi:hypothetical protein